MTLTASDVASLKSALGWWELAEYMSTGVLFVGCIGEFFAEFTRFPKSERARHKLARLSLILVIGGIAGELCATVRTSELSGQIIAYVQENAADAKKSADAAAQDAKDASSSAQQAKGDAGQAELIARGARQEADSFENDIKSAKEQSAGAESHLAEALRSAAGAEHEAAQAEAELAKYRAPRWLTDLQAQAIVDKVQPFGPQVFEVTPYWSSNESLGIAQRMADVLTRVPVPGWNLEQPKRWTALLGGVVGVIVWVHPSADDRTKGAAAALAAALNHEGIEAKTSFQNPSDAKTNKIGLEVGTKQ